MRKLALPLLLAGALVGDVDGNGSIELGDARILIMIASHEVEIPSSPSPEFTRADANADGALDLGDAVVVLRHVAGYIRELPHDGSGRWDAMRWNVERWG